MGRDSDIVETSAHTTAALSSAEVVGVDDDVSYRTISVLAILSLVLGVAAPLCMIAPLLLALPIAGTVLALLAIRQISASDGTLIGRKAAMIGLALCVASICASLSYQTLRQELLSRQARGVAREWIALLQAGNVQGAFELSTVSLERRAPPPPDMRGAPEEPEQPPFEIFRQEPVVRFLMERAKGATVKYVRDVSLEFAQGGTRIQQEYSAAPAADSAGEPTTDILLTLARSRVNRTSPLRWMVAGYRSDSLPPDRDEDGHSHPHSH